ncbi:MAG: hypothetical protein H2184_15715 [Candidatus Galacturonibacter soehngenii]|nr:hypothetical protein [Candidatus Galacturonibacter soehngenii]
MNIGNEKENVLLNKHELYEKLLSYIKTAEDYADYTLKLGNEFLKNPNKLPDDISIDDLLERLNSLTNIIQNLNKSKEFIIKHDPSLSSIIIIDKDILNQIKKISSDIAELKVIAERK